MELITTTAELAQVLTLNADFPIARLKGHLRSAETFLRTQVGGAVVDRILDASNPSADEQELRQLMRRVVGNLALFRYAQVSNVDITAIGNQRTKSENTSDAFEWQVERLSRQLESDAMEALEETLGWLDDHADVITQYQPVDEARLIRSAGLYSSYVYINDSRLVFRTLVPSLSAVEDRYRSVPALRAFITDYDDANEDQRRNMENLRRALAHAAMARALRQRVVDLTADGVQVRAISQVLTLHYRQAPSESTLAATIQFHEREANSWLTSVQNDIRPTDSPAVTGGPRGTQIVGF